MHGYVAMCVSVLTKSLVLGMAPIVILNALEMEIKPAVDKQHVLCGH